MFVREVPKYMEIPFLAPLIELAQRSLRRRRNCMSGWVPTSSKMAVRAAMAGGDASSLVLAGSYVNQPPPTLVL
jgi:hypothetical protein